jgi:primary-amine oxidase
MELTQPTVNIHPLDPLTGQEVDRTAAIVRGHSDVPESAHFVLVSTAEPRRHGVPASSFRAAEVVVHDHTSRTTYELLVDLTESRVTSVTELTGVEPQLTTEEFLAVEAAVRDSPAFQKALRRRGIEDLSRVDIDPVSSGSYGTPEETAHSDRRLARILAYVRPDEGGNAYARPIEGVFGLVDVRTGEIVHFEDRETVPLPSEDGEYRADRISLRTDVKPIHIAQPEGASFSVDGHEVHWQKWRFRVGFSTREGLVLHQIGYEDDGALRPILHRASYAEMVVPYADPDRFYQTPLDIGEFNIGTMTNSLTLGCDCLGVIHYFDAAYCDSSGKAVVIPNAICLHEEDDGLLWKHTDFRTGHVEVRRGRRLVVSSIVTVGNYEYGFFWYFHQDGVISSEIKATGIVATQAVEANEPTAYGKLVAPNLNSIHHQHIFCARLDFDLDGGGNSIAEVESEGDPEGEDNPHGNAWRTVSRTLQTELEARRHINPFTARGWLISNPSRRNGVGEAPGYRLMPGDNTIPPSAEGSSARRRAGFMDYHLWVTPYEPSERYPAGDYPYQHAGGTGLPSWVEADRRIEDTDLVVWYTLNHHHVPRPEDWPVMPVVRIGFELKPWGFFDRSPALDVPPTQPGEGSCHADERQGRS